MVPAWRRRTSSRYALKICVELLVGRACVLMALILLAET